MVEKLNPILSSHSARIICVDRDLSVGLSKEGAQTVGRLFVCPAPSMSSFSTIPRERTRRTILIAERRRIVLVSYRQRDERPIEEIDWRN